MSSRSAIPIMHRTNSPLPDADADLATDLAELAENFKTDIQAVERQTTSLRTQLQHLEQRPATSLTSADVRFAVSESVRLKDSELMRLFVRYLRRARELESVAEQRGLCSVKKAAVYQLYIMRARISALDNFFRNKAPVEFFLGVRAESSSSYRSASI